MCLTACQLSLPARSHLHQKQPGQGDKPVSLSVLYYFFKCMERIQKRGRESEVAQLSFLNLDYVTEVGNQYTSWIESPDTLRKVLDSDLRRHKVE